MSKAERLRKQMDCILGWICVLLFTAMIGVGTYQIVSRYFFRRPSTMSEELLTYSFTWLSLLAAAYVFGKREHMRMGFIVERFSEKVQYWLGLLMEGIIFLFAGVVMVYGGISIMRLTMTQITASLGVPMGAIYTVVPLSGILIMVYALLNIRSMIEKGGKKT